VGRVAVVVLFVAVLTTAGCGGGGSSASADSIASLLKRPVPEVAVTPGAGDFVPGPVRYPFAVIDHKGRPIERPTAEVWVATRRDTKPFAHKIARLEPIGIPGKSKPAFGELSRLYVVHFRIPRAGRYWLMAEPKGAKIQAVTILDVQSRLPVPAVGSKAPASATPTLADASAQALTTARPPDTGLLHYSIASSLAAHAPFVVTFATPKFCTSRTCGPVVDVVDAVRTQFAASPVRFIHVEVYTDNDPTKGYNRWMRQWGLSSEPWTFLVGADGRVRAEFQGSVSAAELAAAIRRRLL
jgi:hypothetical protein